MKKRRNYIFTNKRNSDRAIMAVILGVISLISLGIVVLLTYRSGGEATVGYGLTGVLATIFSLTGLVLAIMEVQDKSNYRFFPVLGVVLNALTLAGIALILYAGTNL